jgi:peptide-methionine (R)-S-oxide reductase
MTTRLAILGVLALLAACRPAQAPQAKEMPMKPECSDCAAPAKNTVVEDPMKISEAEWKKRLTPDQYYVCRQKGTEAPETGAYLHHKEKGTYDCVACGQPLFSSDTKYDACGWPSFWNALPNAVRVESDLESVCTKCGSHLGHRFNDGPKPTGWRY